MALPSSGTITIQQIATEFGGSAPYSLSNYYRGGALVANTPANAGIPTSGTIRLSNFYGASKSRVTVNLVISSNTQNFDVYANRGPSYVAGNTDVVVTINSGIFVGASSTGVYAFTVSSSFNAGDTVAIVNNGTILGCGGGGGAGGYGGNGGGGGGGGNTLQINRATRITNNGVVASGGGGGGGGGFGIRNDKSAAQGGGGGGGAGYNGGGGGSPNGGAGSTTAGGAGGGGQQNAGSGGVGGGRGANGASGTAGSQNAGGGGGLAGYYVVGNTNVTWVATGTRLGRVI